MTDFKGKMHQIRFRLADPAGGAYSAPPDPLAGFGGLLLRRGKGRRGEGKEETGGEGGEGGEGMKGGERRGGEGERKERAMSPPPTIWRKFTPMNRTKLIPTRIPSFFQKNILHIPSERTSW